MSARWRCAPPPQLGADDVTGRQRPRSGRGGEGVEEGGAGLGGDAPAASRQPQVLFSRPNLDLSCRALQRQGQLER